MSFRDTLVGILYCRFVRFRRTLIDSLFESVAGRHPSRSRRELLLGK